jgi:hypothetical protein
MASTKTFDQDAPIAERPFYLKILVALGIGASAGIVGYSVGKLAAGSSDFSAGQMLPVLVGVAMLCWATFDAIKRGAKAGKLFMQSVTGAVLGAAFVLAGYFLFQEPLKAMIKTGSAWQLAAVAIGSLYLIFAVVLLPLGFRKTLPSAEPMQPSELRQWKRICIWSSFSCFGYTAAIFCLLAGSMRTDVGPDALLFSGVALAMCVQLAGTWMLWRIYDELWRAATRDACAITFVIVEVMLFIWASLTLSGFNVAFDPLGLIVVTSAIYLATTIFITFKRGMDEM